MKETEADILILDEPSYYTEGPVVSRDGTIYFTTLAGGEIRQLGKNGLSLPWAKATCPNGQAIMQDETRLVCDSAGGQLLGFDRNGRLKDILVDRHCAGRQVTTPNDVTVDSKGIIYFTDSVRHTGSVFRLHPGGNPELLLTGLDYPNGIVLSPDDRFLYVAESYKNSVSCYSLSGGTINHAWTCRLPRNASGKEVDNLPDGLCLDWSGNVYVAHYGMSAIQVLTAAGERTGSIRTPFPLVSNLACMGNGLIVTGGYAEPGPGIVALVTAKHFYDNH